MLVLCLLLTSQLLLTVFLAVNIYPELSVLPWLVSKGLVPYRDFFDHHGFLIYYLLSPLSQDKSLFLIKLFYLGLQALNLILFWLIIRCQHHRVWQLVLGLLFIFLNFFTNENNFWFESVIAFFYLLIFYLLQFKRKPWFLIGLLIGLASLIKPTAAAILLPLIILFPNLSIVIGFTLIWILTLGYFASQQALISFWQNLFVFNSYLSNYVKGTYHWRDLRFLIISLVLFIATINWQKKVLWHRYQLLILSFLFVGLLFLYPFYGRVHLVVVSTFFPIWLSQVILNGKGFYRVIIGLYLLYLGFLGYRHWQFLYFDRTIYQHSKVIQNIIKVYKNSHNGQSFWVMGNNAELYYYLDQLPPTYFPLFFRDWTGKFFPDFETRIIASLKQQQIKIVFEPKPRDINFTDLKFLHQYLERNYLLVKYQGFNIYRFKTR